MVRIWILGKSLSCQNPGLVAARGGGFVAHGLGGFLQRDEDSGDKLLIVHIAEQRRHIRAVHAAAFDLHEDFFALLKIAQPFMAGKFAISFFKSRQGRQTIPFVPDGTRDVFEPWTQP